MDIEIISYWPSKLSTGAYPLKGIVRVKYAGLIIKCKHIGGQNGDFIGMPSEKNKDGKFFDVCYFEDKGDKAHFNKRCRIKSLPVNKTVINKKHLMISRFK
jgi:hypothetical protein